MDTAQPIVAAETDPNAQLQNVADAFKAFTTGEPVERPRDESGKFVSTAEEIAEPEAEEVEGEVEIDEDEQEAAEEAQPMPPSWPADKAEIWEALPADAKAFVAERDAEQLKASNAKFQEAANARKAAEALQSEAKAARDQFASQLDVLMAAIQPVKPDPRQYGLGTGQYNREAYDLAVLEYEQQAQALAQLTEQRENLATQAQQEEAQAYEAHLKAINAEWGPKFAADVPDLTDPVKGGAVIASLIEYATQHGIDPAELAEDRLQFIPFSQMHLLWKAQQFDKLRANPPQPKPKTAGPAVRPGVSSPRSAQGAAQRQRISDRLAREGSIEAGAALWKSVLKGK